MTAGIGVAPRWVGGEPAPTALEGLSWVLLVVLLSAVIAGAALSGDPLPALHVGALVVLGGALFRGTAGQLFRVGFVANVVWVFVLAHYFTGVNGAPYTGGGDDLMFFRTSTDVGQSWLRGDGAAHLRYTNYSGYGYILLGGALHFLSAPIGETGPEIVRLWGAFAGATIGPAVLLLSRAVLVDRPERFHAAVAAAAALFPILTYYAALGLRDIWLAALSTWVIATLALSRALRPGVTTGWVWPVVLVLVSGVFRPESAVALIAFWLGLLFARRHTTGARVASGAIVVGAIAVAALFLDVIVAQLIRQQLSYAYAVDAAGSGSLGARILQIPGPAGWLARYLYAVVTPVPPLAAIRPDTILVGIGASAWYFMIPLAVAGHRAVRRLGPEQKAIADGMAVFSGMLLLAIALTSIDVRHKLPLIPVGVVLSAAALELHDRRWRYDLLLAVGFVGAVLGAAYLILKAT